MIWRKISIVVALMASPTEPVDETPVTLSKATQESIELRNKYQIAVPKSSDIIYIRSVGVHHVKTEFSTVAWRDSSGGWIVSQVGEEGPGGLLKIEPRLISEKVQELSARNANKVDKILRSSALYTEKVTRTGNIGIGALFHEMEIISSTGSKFVKWDGRLKGKSGRLADIVLTTASQAPINKLGYPVFVSVDGGKCFYGIQNMIHLGKTDVRRWINDLSDKERQIDLVLDEKKSERCVRPIRRTIQEVGFENVRTVSSARWLRAAKNANYSELPPQ